jgi:hypothetical protein
VKSLTAKKSLSGVNLQAKMAKAGRIMRVLLVSNYELKEFAT